MDKLQVLGEKMEALMLNRWGKMFFQTVIRLLLTAAFVNNTQQIYSYLGHYLFPIYNLSKGLLVSYFCLLPVGCLLFFLPRVHLVGSLILLLLCAGQWAYSEYFGNSYDPDVALLVIAAGILIVTCSGFEELPSVPPSIFTRQGFIALTKALMRLILCFLSLNQSLFLYSISRKVILVRNYSPSILNAIIAFPMLLGYRTRTFALLFATVNWMMFYHKFGEYYSAEGWYRFCEMVSMTGAHLAFFMSGPGAYSFDEVTKKREKLE